MVRYDATALSNPQVLQGALLDSCHWEYFAYRVDTINSLIRIVALAETNTHDTHPSCYLDTSGELAIINFHTELNSDLICKYYPVEWYWTDCGDNSFSDYTGDSLFISNDVYSFDGYTVLTQNDTFPTFYGAPLECDSIDAPNPLYREIDFYNGGVEFICADITDDNGDINLNGIPNEIADWVIFANYLIYGESVFSVNKFAQARASDVNRDGVPLTLDDYVYMWRIVTGDALPIETSPDITLTDTAFVIQDSNNMTVKLTYLDSIVAAYLIFEGEIVPDTTGNPFQFGFYFDTVQTKVLLASYDAAYDFANFGTGELFKYSGDGTLVGVAVSSGGLSLIPTNLPIAYDSTIFCCINRGNVDGISNGTDIVNIRDLTFLVNFVFGHPSSSEPICMEEANLDGSYSLAEAVNILDLIFMVDYLFKGGPPPSPCP